MTSPADILAFWFEEHGPKYWYAKNAAFDQLIRERFFAIYGAAAAGELWAWRKTPEGRLAEIIVLDQFSRNLFRDDARAFACDLAALVLAQEAVAQNADQQLNAQQRQMLYMPFMHSESLVVHETSIKLFTALGVKEVLDYAVKHRDIIARFGRYPHRNEVLARQSTAEEFAFLKEPGSSF